MSEILNGIDKCPGMIYRYIRQDAVAQVSDMSARSEGLQHSSYFFFNYRDGR